jgi:hypothetical protein
MKLKLFLIISILLVNCEDSEDKKSVKLPIEQSRVCGLKNLIGYASFEYSYSDLFKTGIINKPQFKGSFDTTMEKDHKLYTFKTFDLEKHFLKVATSNESRSSSLLVVKDEKAYSFQVKELGVFEFVGVKDDRYFFSFTFPNCELYFSLRFEKSDVDLVEYTVQSD